MPDPPTRLDDKTLDRLYRENQMRKSWMEGLPFCSDHRDKMAGLTCRQCEIERLNRELAKAHRTIKAMRESGKWFTPDE